MAKNTHTAAVMFQPVSHMVYHEDVNAWYNPVQRGAVNLTINRNPEKEKDVKVSKQVFDNGLPVLM